MLNERFLKLGMQLQRIHQQLPLHTFSQPGVPLFWQYWCTTFGNNGAQLSAIMVQCFFDLQPQYLAFKARWKNVYQPDGSFCG